MRFKSCVIIFVSFVDRQKSAWNDAKLCALIVRCIACALERACAELHLNAQAVMIFDALPTHLSALVLDALFASSLWPLVVPVKTTKWLAPLDTHVFSPLKSLIEERVDKCRSESLNGDMNMAAFIRCVREAIEEVLMKRAWAQAFSNDGYAFQQAGVSRELCIIAGSTHPLSTPVISNSAPSLSQVEACLPQRSKDKAAIIWRRFLQPLKESSRVAGASPSAASILTSPTSRIFERTRSRTSALRMSVMER